MAIKLYNTLTRKKEVFKPIYNNQVGLYCCGLTVYDYAHIGNLKKYIGDDVLKRVLKYNGYKVKHVTNITDVGHLTSDEDTGEDKIERGAKATGKTVWEVARFFEDYFLKSLKEVNVQMPNIMPRASEHIAEQINLIKKLEKKGYTYKTQQAIYFDVSKFPNYTKLTGQKLEEKIIGAREETVIDKEKKNPYDFALWFFTVGRFTNHTMKWPSPWGEGFPGWHIECSAMSMKYLGQTIDIHTGGIDHRTIHHPNEIAQSEAATGRQFVRFWVHHDWLLVDGEKMSKSKKNFYTIDDIKNRGVNPLAFRYLMLTAHYRSKLNFTWQSLEAAQKALKSLSQAYSLLGAKTCLKKKSRTSSGFLYNQNYSKKFLEAINDDLNTPRALAIVWKLIKDKKIADAEKKQILLDFDQVLGLGLAKIKKIRIPEKIKKLVNQREKLRQEKKWQEADEIRKKIEELEYKVEDTKEGPKILKI